MRERVVEIRLASAADAPAIAELHGRSFVATYPDLSRTIAGINQGLSRRVTLWTDRIENSPMGCATFVAHEDLRIVGFVFVGPSGDEDDLGAHTGQVFSIHVDPTGLRGRHRKTAARSCPGFPRVIRFQRGHALGGGRQRPGPALLRGPRLAPSTARSRNEILAIEGPEGDEVDVVRYRIELNPREDQ